MTTDERKQLEAMATEWERDASIVDDAGYGGSRAFAKGLSECAAALRAFIASIQEQVVTLEDAERIVKAKYPGAHPVIVRADTLMAVAESNGIALDLLEACYQDDHDIGLDQGRSLVHGAYKGE